MWGRGRFYMVGFRWGFPSTTNDFLQTPSRRVESGFHSLPRRELGISTHLVLTLTTEGAPDASSPGTLGTNDNSPSRTDCTPDLSGRGPVVRGETTKDVGSREGKRKAPCRCIRGERQVLRTENSRPRSRRWGNVS